MSNLYKGQVNRVRSGYYTRIIDHNEILEQKLSAVFMEQEAKLRRQLAEDPQAAENAGFQKGILPAQMDVPADMGIDYVEEAKEQAAQIVQEATGQAEQILKKAVGEAENLKEETRQEASRQGYSEGMQQAQAEAEQMRRQLDEQRRQLEEEYKARMEQMEPELMQVVIDVFEKVMQADFAMQQKILLHLIRSTVQHIKNSREFRLRVSGADYDNVLGHREEILQKIGGEAALDIIMDDSMQQGQCTIDTEEGIFDCGLDVQFENLTRDLKALSCMN